MLGNESRSVGYSGGDRDGGGEAVAVMSSGGYGGGEVSVAVGAVVECLCQ